MLAGGAALAGGGLLALCFVGARLLPERSIPLHRSSDGKRITAGPHAPTDWIVFDARTMGGPTYGRALRAFLQSPEGRERSAGIAASMDDVPADAKRIAICGDAARHGPETLRGFQQLEEIRVLAPTDPAKWLAAGKTAPSIKVFCGELSDSCPLDDVPGLKTVPGARDHLPSWPQLAFARP